jgi:peptidyl-prolyl isomerase G (cyclophilin G)
MSSRNKFTHVYMDITIGSTPAGKVIFELFTDTTPLTAENFRGLCTGEYGTFVHGGQTRPLSFVNSEIFKISKNVSIHGGDIINNKGTSGYSIYGLKFNDENFQRQHSKAGLLSMVSRGRNSNCSQFLVTLKPMPELDNKNVVFGHVIYGMDAIYKIANAEVDMHDSPKMPIIVIDCGEMDDKRAFITKDPLGLEGMKRIRDANKYNRLFFEEKREESILQPYVHEQAEALKPIEQKDLNDKYKNIIQKSSAADNLSGIDKVLFNLKEKSSASQHLATSESIISSDPKEKTSGADQLLSKREEMNAGMESRLLDLKLKLNQIRAKNIEVVEEEELRNKDPSILKNEKVQYKKEKLQAWTENLAKKQIEQFPYLDQAAQNTLKPDADPLSIAQLHENNEIFGWNGNIISFQQQQRIQCVRKAKQESSLQRGSLLEIKGPCSSEINRKSRRKTTTSGSSC